MGMALLGMAPLALRGAGSGCAANVVQRAMQVGGIAQGVIGGVGRMAEGDYIGGLLDLVSAGVSARRFMQSCFADYTSQGLRTLQPWVRSSRTRRGIGD